MRGGPDLVARSLIRSWRRHPLRAIAALLGVVVGALLATAIVSVSSTMVSAIRGGTAVDLLDADMVAVARSASGMSPSTVEEIEEAAGPADTVGVLNVSTRLADDRDAIIAVLGVTAGAEAFVEPSEMDVGDPVEPSSGTSGLVVGQDWAEANGQGPGDVIDLAAPGGISSFTITGIIDGDLPNEGAVGLAPIDEVDAAFAREGQIDAVYFKLDRADSVDEVAGRVEEASGGSVTAGPPSIAADSGIAALALVRMVFSAVGVAGFAVAAAVLLVCWRLLLDDESPSLARFRLVGGRPRDLTVGSGVVFGAAGLLCAAIGVPLGFVVAGLLEPLAQELAALSGLAGVVDSGPRPGPALAGVAAVLVMCLIAWATGLRSLLRLSPIEGFRGPVAARPRPIPLVPALAASAVLVVGFALGAAYLSTDAAGLVIVLAIGAAVALAAVAPTVLGRVLARREGFLWLAAGRELSAQARKRAGMVAVFAVTNILVVMLFGMASSLQTGVSRSVEAWTASDLFVLAGEPGRALRDQRLAADTPERLAEIPGVEAVTPFRLTFLSIEGKPAQLWAWEVATADATTDLDPTSGLEGEAMWQELGRGGVAVSGSYAYQHSVEVGDHIEFPSASGTSQHEVVAIIPEYTVDGGVIYSSLETFESVTGDQRNYDIVLDLEPGADRAEVAAQVETELEDYPELVVWTGTEMLDSIMGTAEQAFSVLNMLAVTCLVLALLAGAATSTASVAARRAPLAMSRVIGVTARGTRRQLWLESIALGVAAWLIALPIGIPATSAALEVLGAQNGFFPPAVIPVAALAVILPLSIAAIAVALWLPARSLSREGMVEVLRDE